MGWGAVTTDHVTCCPVCMWCWGGVEFQHTPCDEVEVQHKPCDVQSCMSVGLGWGEVTTQTMRRVVLHFCGVEVGWSYNTDHVTCCPVCLWG